MVLVGSSFFAISGRAELTPAGPTVVWLRGEHDITTDVALCLTVARAIALNDAPLVLDLSEVEFLGVSTLRVIVRAREFLHQRSRSLTVRSPSAPIQRLMGLCGLDDLLGRPTAGKRALSRQMLGLRAEARVPDRSDRQEGPLVPAMAPVLLSQARARRAHPTRAKGVAGVA